MKIRKYQKHVAIFLLLNIFTHLFYPVLLKAGSITADEYDSFMPAGYSDMVDTRTGDFHYDVPLFDVPSPEGSYPLHLFYEGGIKNDKNATWTGLGWNLNVGAITREVNDIPDDFAGESYLLSESVNPTSSLDTNYSAVFPMGYSLANQDAGRALFMPFQSSSVALVQYGALHADMAYNHRSLNYATYDCHAMYSEDETEQLVDGSSPEALNGGSMPSYDAYNVSAEGLSGQIEPVVLENGTLFRSTVESILPYPYSATRAYPILQAFTQPKQYFRFKGEFANSYTASANAFTFSSGPSLSFSGNAPAYTYTVQDAVGFTSGNMRLAGGKHVDYFTNSEITGGTAKAAGFLDYPYYILENGGYSSSTSERKQLYFFGNTTTTSNRIGGFTVTNEEGMTYHYALPVYTYDNTNTRKVATPTGVYVSRTFTNTYAYAYSWLLTTVTGPDYIDKNNNGYADEGDLGQWTNFSYGKASTSSGYGYRFPNSPGNVYHEYSSGGIQTSEAGGMELYFLDAVYTRSHTALLSKDTRSDGLGSNGTAPMKLNSAILFSNDGIKTISRGMHWKYSNLYTALKNIKAADTTYSEAITVADINAISGTTATNYASQILKESKLTYDYSLCKNALNSAPGLGKLTLLSVKNYGKNNTPLAPSTDFQYELPNPQSATISITSYSTNTAVNKSGQIIVSSNTFSVGDIISFNISGITYYAALTQAITSSDFLVMFLGNNIPGISQMHIDAIATQTKNPDYSYYIDVTQKYISSFSDQWGYFKCDVSLNENFDKDHKTSYASSKAVDCWSLRKITTGLGSTIEINYESDSYYGSQLTEGEIFSINQKYKYTDKNTHSLRISNSALSQISKLDTAGTFEYSFQEDITGKLQAGDTVIIATLGTISYKQSSYLTSRTVDGKSSFYISYVDVGRRLIRGKFLGTPSARQNPMANATTYSYATDTSAIFYNNSSFLFKSLPTVSYGGGLRVASIKIKEGNGETYSTNYSYTNRYNNSSSGTVPFIPIIEEAVNIPQTDGNVSHTDPTIPGNQYLDASIGMILVGGALYPEWEVKMEDYTKEFTKVSLKAQANTDFISSWVLYEFVTVTHVGNGSTSLKSEEYNYQPHTYDLIRRSDQNVLSGTDGTPAHRQWTTHKMVISDYTSAVGQLLNYSQYDSSGTLASRTTYAYTSIPPASQGILEEVFHEEREFPSGSINKGVAIVTVKATYPSVLSSIDSYDYLKNIHSTKYFNKYDFYSGNPTEIVSKNSEGDYFKQTSVPAYTKSQYSGMALKFTSNTNRNMLSPLTATYTYKVDSTNYNAIDTLSCSVNTWSNSWSKRVLGSLGYFTDSTISTDNGSTVQDDRIWRPQSSYVWKSPVMNANGSYKNFVDFNWGGALNANWQKVSTITKYDQFSNVIEKQDINGNYTAVKYGYDLTYPVEGSNNTNYAEFAYSGAEDLNSNTLYGSPYFFGGEVSANSLGPTQDTTIAHTGKSSLILTQYGSGFIYKVPIATGGVSLNRPYRITAWVYNNGNTSVQMYYNLLSPSGTVVSTPNSGSITPATVASPVVAGQWQQLTLDFTLTGSYSNYILNIGFSNPSSTPAYIDDFRFHPLSETVTTNVYDKATGQVTHSLDGNNFYSKRVYDNSYRPVGLYKETIYGEIKQKEYQYNFGKK